jgi:hypothetical protein
MLLFFTLKLLKAPTGEENLKMNIPAMAGDLIRNWKNFLWMSRLAAYRTFFLKPMKRKSSRRSLLKWKTKLGSATFSIQDR